VILNIVKIKKLHQDLTERLERQISRKLKMKWFQIEEKIYFWINNIWMKTKSKKLSNKSIESFMIVKNIKKINYELDLFKKMQIHLIFHAFMLQHCNQIILLQINETSVELNKEYEIKNILEKRIISKKAHYLIK